MAPHLLISALLLLVCTGAYGDSRCQATHTCTNAGYFPRCPDFCDTQYFSCDATGNAGVLSTCPFGLVFDPDPTSHKCVLFQNCTLLSTPCAPNPPACSGVFEIMPACPNCYSLFYMCDPNQPTGTQVACGTGLMFNPIPSHPGCIPESDCPCTDPSC
ncbi:uncharacterized protein LOC135092472 [Scylla paramamosain]|uniref:uncharacterized protein LOC135092472 n=1 Tax=Scylla paramamosain TaxID=85552 RepID=UPI00308367BB